MNAVAVTTRANRGNLFATFVSVALCPPLAALMAVFVLEYPLESYLRALVYLVAAVGWPCAVLFALWLLGFVSDLDVSVRKERFGVNLAALMGIVPAWVWFHKTGVEDGVQTLVSCHALLLVLLSGITLYWKVSYHTAVSGVLCGTLLSSYGIAGIICLVGLAVVGWSRVHLGKHTLSQATVGAPLGLGCYFCVVFFA